MSSEDEIRQDAVENPDARRAIVRLTGEVVELTGPDEDIIEAISAIDGYIEELQSVRVTLNDELVDRMDRSASWTMKGRGFKLSAPSPTAGEKLDDAALAESMKTLVEDGVIEMPAYDKAFSREVKLTMPDRAWVALKVWVDANAEKGVKADVKWKVAKGGLNAIMKVAGDRGAALKAAATLAPTAPRRVKVEKS